MDKRILEEYTDACELIKETEKDIARLNKKKTTVLQTNVKGSNPDFPYQEQHFSIQGITYTVKDDRQLRHEQNLLGHRKAKAAELKQKVEEWMLTVPMRMQRIIKYRFLEGLSWEETAERMGRRSTGESLRKEFERFLEKN